MRLAPDGIGTLMLLALGTLSGQAGATSQVSGITVNQRGYAVIGAPKASASGPDRAAGGRVTRRFAFRKRERCSESHPFNRT